MKKKVLSTILVLGLAASLMAGCGAKTTESGDATEKKVLTAAANIDYAPFEFYEDGVAVGFDVDLWNEICSRLGYEAEFVHYPWDGLISGLQSKKFDAIVADMEITPEREESVLFTDPYFYETIGIAKRAGTDYTELADLQGYSIGLQTGTVAETWAEAEKETIAPEEYVKYETMADALMDLKATRTEAVINNGPYIQYQATLDSDIEVMAIIDDDPIDCGIAFNMEDEELRNQVNDVMKEIIADGTYQKLYQKWFGADPNPDFMPAE